MVDKILVSITFEKLFINDLDFMSLKVTLSYS